MPIMYEWVLEILDSDDEIEDVQHQPDVDGFADAQIASVKSGECRLALVKKSFDETGHLKWMDYAYLREDGTLAAGDFTGFIAPTTYQKALSAKINRYV